MNAEHTLLRIRCGKENERGPYYSEPAISAIHSLKGKHANVNLEVGMGNDGKIALFVRSTKQSVRLIEGQLYAQYPDIDIELAYDDPFAVSDLEEVYWLDLKLQEPEVFPIKRHPQFDDLLMRVNVDPIAGISSSLARYDIPGMRAHVQIALHPVGGSFRKRALRFLPLLKRGMPSVSDKYANVFTRMVLARGWKRLLFFPIATLMGGFRAWIGRKLVPVSLDVNAGLEREDEAEKQVARSHDREDPIAGAQDKVNRLLFASNVRLSVIVPRGKKEEAFAKLSEMVGSFRQFALPHSNEFAGTSPKRTDTLQLGLGSSSYILSVEEVATMWHLPTLHVQTPNLDWVLSKKLEPPLNLPLQDEKNVTLLGNAVYRGERKVFGIRPDDRRRHFYVLGKTGMGKSTLLENMIWSDVQSGKGVGVIDPHGDLIEAILGFIPKNRMNDLVLFDPADKDYPISFNILDCPEPDQRTLVASGIMSVFTKLWPDVWSGRMEHILRNTLLALLEFEGSSMLGIMRMFADTAYRDKVVSKVSDPLVKSFWIDEYASWTDKYRTEAISAIQNKVGQLLSTPLIRNIVGQVKSTVDIRHAMDTGKIVLVNLSKGKLGEDTSAFLGSMLVTKFQIDAMSRADIPESERKDFYLYVDEFQNFATESFATILSEARKYRLNLTMANQYVSQLLIGDRNTSLRDAVFGNVGTLMSFQVGSDDAEVLSLQFEEMVTPKDILSLPKYHAYSRLMIDGMPSKPFSVTTLPPPEPEKDPNRKETLRRLSRERYSESRKVVEEKIQRWAQSAQEGKNSSKSVEKAKEKEEEEIKKAQKKGMSLKEYRAWRDRELWTNEYNQLRKKSVLGEDMSKEEQKLMKEYEEKLVASGGIPPMSKGLQELIEKKK